MLKSEEFISKQRSERNNTKENKIIKKKVIIQQKAPFKIKPASTNNSNIKTINFLEVNYYIQIAEFNSF